MKIVINKHKYKVPNSFEELTLKQYQQILLLDDDMIKSDKLLAVTGIMCNIPVDVLNDVPISDFKAIEGYIGLRYQEILNNAKESKVALQPILKIKGKEYGFINDIKKISTAEYLDLDVFAEDIPNNIHSIMAILYRPVVKVKKPMGTKITEYFLGDKVRGLYTIDKYNFNSVEQRADLFLDHMKLDTVLGSMVFFSRLSLSSSLHTSRYLTSLLEEKKKILKEMKK